MKKNELFDSYLNDSLTPEEEQKLLTILEDEQNADKFAEYIIETSMMVGAADTVKCVPAQKTKSKLRYILPAAIAACLALAIILTGENTVSLNVLASSSADFTPGTEITVNDLQVDHGKVVFKTPAGNIIEVKGPSKLQFHTDSHFRLFSGMANVRLSKNSSGFTVDTAQGSVKDLGTAFGISAKRNLSEVHVYEGSIKVTTSTDSKTLLQGESVQFLTKEFKDISFNDNILEEKPDVLFLGERKLRPGEQMELQMDKGGKEMTAQVSMSFDKDKGLKYKLIARSKGTKIFESEEHTAKDNFNIKIPAVEGPLTIEMKVVKGAVVNGIVKLNDVSIMTEGVRPYEGESLVPAGSFWRYIYKSDPPDNWKSNEFVDSLWLTGQGALGYGDYDLKTKIGSNELRKTISRIYLRKEFSLKGIELNSLKKISLHLLADDGAVIYMNGREIVRYNLPEEALSTKSRAIKRAVSSSGEMIYRNFSVPSESLVMGKNVVCVVLYQIEGKSSDMRFDLKVSAF